MVAGFDLFRPLIVGMAGAIVVVLVAWVAAMSNTGWKKLSPFAAINAGTAWSPSDSWVTNIAAVASLLTATWTQLGTGSPPLVPAKAGSGILLLFITFAATASLAPVIYASCTRQANVDATKNQGTVAGYVLAACATLFAVGGEMMALEMFIAKAIHRGSARDILVGFLIAGAAFVALYSWRTMYNVLTVDVVTAERTSTAARGIHISASGHFAADPGDFAALTATRSLLLVPANKRSATL